MSGSEHGKRVQVPSHIDSSMLTIQELAIQVKSSDMRDLLEDAAKADETLLHVEDRELARLLWERIGNSNIVEKAPPIKEDLFYLVGLRKPDGAADAGRRG